MRYIIKEAFILVHRAVFITSYCVSYDFIFFKSIIIILIISTWVIQE